MRLIDADALKKTIKNMPNDYYGDLCVGDALKEIDNAPTISVAPVVRGAWVDSNRNYSLFVMCSACKGPHFQKSKYCPNCGCDMRGERDGEK